MNKKSILLPPKISMKPFEGSFINVMPCILPQINNKRYGGVKIVTRYPGRIPSLSGQIMLLDAINGEYLALMDGDWITTMRTGIVAATSIMLLAKRNYTNIAIIGLGNTSRATLFALISLNPQKHFNIKLKKYKQQESEFIQRFSHYRNITFTCVETNNELLSRTDVLISGISYTDEDLFDDLSFEDGVLVIPIHTRGFSNCDLSFDKVFADDTNHVSHFKYFHQFKKFGEISDVLNGIIPGRENYKEKIIVYNIGIAAHDIFFASKIYERLNIDNLKSISLEPPIEKHWF